MGTANRPIAEGTTRRQIVIRGLVQGVGFRPCVYRLAAELGLAGWVTNSTTGVTIELEGPAAACDHFVIRLRNEHPPHAVIESMTVDDVTPLGETCFVVRPSADGGRKTAPVLPDLATCPDCLREIFDPADRRYRYPFTNCTNCGPRHTIITGLPYDRERTTMRVFAMCPACRAEYENPADRRFHAQPNACPACGPHLELWDPAGRCVGRDDDALLYAAETVRNGSILALKGLGGFHLIVDARSESVVHELRKRKGREEKPLALMYPTLDAVAADCDLAEIETRLLAGAAAPIVLARARHRTGNSQIASAVAPSNPYLGVMLPYTPLHHLLMRALDFPIVATSGNRSDEPICTDEREAVHRLAGIADLFLVHNRPIARYVDDSVVRVVADRPLFLRRARGYAPVFLPLKSNGPALLAVGGHLKNTVAATVGEAALLSAHVGDLETALAYHAFRAAIADIQDLYETVPRMVACDLHPDYTSTRHAQTLALPLVPVQHHHAHILACMADNDLECSALGVAWDGTGYGSDGTIWGGEFLRVDATAWTRVAHLRPFSLPGGDRAIVEPRRAALGVLYALHGESLWQRDDLAIMRAFAPTERAVFRQMLDRHVQAPITTSAGRLFDAVAALVGLKERCAFEGQAAMALEFAAAEDMTDEVYPFNLGANTPTVVDWGPMIEGIVKDTSNGMSIPRIAARFHNTLAAMIAAVALRCGERLVVMSGGCFQNKYLTEAAIARLRAAGCAPYWHKRLPPNDGGIALGQLVAAARQHGGQR